MHEQIWSQFTVWVKLYNWQQKPPLQTISFEVEAFVASTFTFTSSITNPHTQFLQVYVVFFVQSWAFEPKLTYNEASIALSNITLYKSDIRV